MAESPLSTAQPVPNVLPDFSFLPLFFLLENARCIEYSGHFFVSSYSSPMMMLNGNTPTVLSRLPGSDSLPVSHFFVSTHENWSSPLPLPHSLTDVRYKRNPIGYRWIFSLMCHFSGIPQSWIPASARNFLSDWMLWVTNFPSRNRAYVVTGAGTFRADSLSVIWMTFNGTWCSLAASSTLGTQ